MTQEAWFSDQTTIFIQEEDGTEINMTVKVLNIKESGFERETEGHVTFGDGRIVQKKPQKDGSVEMEFVMLNTMADKIFWGSTLSGTAPATVYSGGEQNKHRITIIRTDAATQPTATTATVTGEVYRRAYAECYAVTLDPEHESEGFMRAKLTFSASPTDSAASPNVRTDYHATSLAGFSAYTTGSKW